MQLRIPTAPAALCLVLYGCSAPSTPDGGDAGWAEDAGVVEFSDGGRLGIGGCTSRNGSKFIAVFETTAADPPFICVLLSFRRFDGGFTPIMPNFVPPNGYAMDDARYSNGCDFELPDGRLSTVNTAAVTEAWGAAEFAFVLAGRPQSYYLDGGIRLGSRVFTFDGDYAGCNSTCVGN